MSTVSPTNLVNDVLPQRGQLSDGSSLIDARDSGGGLESTLTASAAIATASAPVARSIWKPLRWIGLVLLVTLIVIGSVIALLQSPGENAAVQAGSFDTVQIPLDQLDEVAQGSVQTLAVNGRLVVNDSIVLAPSTQPASAVAGQMYFDQTTNQLAYYNGSAFVGLLGGGGGDTIVQNVTNTTLNNISGGAAFGGSGTPGKLSKFTGVQTVGDSIVTEDGTGIGISGNLNLVDPPTDIPEVSIWPDSATPDVENSPDAHAPPDVELGVKFRSDVDGVVTGIRFYKGSQNTGTHSGSLWTTGGAQLATATFTSETATGWQEVRFSSPVAISADTTYVASYHTSAGFYSITDNYFSTNVDNSPLHALQDGLDGPNGTFRYSLTPAFPDQTFNKTNYWVDVLFKPGTSINKYKINGAQISSADLVNNADLAKRSSSQLFTGTNTFRKSTDAAIAFNIQTTAGINVFSADTLNGRIYIGPQGGGSSGIVLVLGVKTNSGDPIGVEGAMYYSDTLKTFRCFRSNAWADCSEIDPSRGFSQYEEFMGGDDATGTVGSLGWTVFDIGGSSTISFDPTTPAPSADRPGVLSVATPAASSQGSTLALAKPSGASMIIGAGNTLKTAVALGSTADQVLRIGLHTQTTGTTQPVSGVWWEANTGVSNEWRYCYGNGTTATCTGSGIIIAANSWLRFEIRVTATGSGTSAATFLVNGSPINVTGVTIDTTARVSPAFSCYAAAATSKTCYWDYFQLSSSSSAAR